MSILIGRRALRLRRLRKKRFNRSILALSVVMFLLSVSAYAVIHPAFLFSRSSESFASSQFVYNHSMDNSKYKYPDLNYNGEPGTSDEQWDENTEMFELYGKNRVNIALLGFDYSEEKDQELNQDLYRPDTIMIASLDLHHKEVSLLNIPRDSYVKIHGCGVHDKINHSFMHGYYQAADGEDKELHALKTTLFTIQDFLGGITIDEYIVMDIDGAAEIVDTIGGVYYDVDAEVRGGVFGTGKVVIPRGYQHLDGHHFMLYVRNRSVHQGGERARAERQQRIIIALFEQLKSEGRIKDISKLYQAVENNLETSLDLNQVLALGFFAAMVVPQDINTYVFQGEGQVIDVNGQDVWYLIIDEEEKTNVVRKVFHD